MEASYPRFFIPIDFDRFSRIHFPPLRSKGGKSILEKWSRESKFLLVDLPVFLLIITGKFAAILKKTHTCKQVADVNKTLL